MQPPDLWTMVILLRDPPVTQGLVFRTAAGADFARESLAVAFDDAMARGTQKRAIVADDTGSTLTINDVRNVVTVSVTQKSEALDLERDTHLMIARATKNANDIARADPVLTQGNETRN